ncbi:MAG: hypothetical protein BroJett018_21020 [Chloroflexota bacterium]|nr:hypothetical protein [Chloroflexota bacterium]NOG65395.1 hypothetical protein [Chloroflexota bacterium]GIK64308.1 MAG: hypothetical protein BroJett018_21020 [Chloroflexota bacterium]
MSDKKQGKGDHTVSDWAVDPRNTNWESKTVTRPDGSSLEMYRHKGQQTEYPHVSQEYDKNGKTDITKDIHQQKK